MAHPKSITAAAGQIAARFMNDADATLASLETVIDQARAQDADLLVLPECAYPAYLLGSVASYRAGAHMTGEAFVRWLCQQAARCRMHIVSGFVDDGGDRLYNAAVLVDDRGCEIGRSHKRFLWHLDHDWFASGGDIRAFDSRLGRIGMVICAETRAPEILATLAADGAEILAMPTCWINSSRTPGIFANPQIEFLIEARAREFGLPFVCADKSGLELGGIGYVGKSRIVRADGSLAAEAPPTGEAAITARLEPTASTWRPEPPDAARRLRSSEPPVRPAPGDLRPINAAAIPGIAPAQVLDADGPLLHHLHLNRPDLLVLRPADESSEGRLRRRAADLGILLLTPPQACGVIDLAGARAGVLTGPAAESFALPRAMVLDGVGMLVFWSQRADLPILRTRALENRVFVIAVTDRFAAIIGPEGELLSYASIESAIPPIATLTLSQAADKYVAERTDLLEERQPGLYRF
jgi:predicted amidohydrolase